MPKTPELDPCMWCGEEMKLESTGKDSDVFRAICSTCCGRGPWIATEEGCIRVYNRVARRLDRGRILRVLGGVLSRCHVIPGLWPPPGYKQGIEAAAAKIREMK